MIYTNSKRTIIKNYHFNLNTLQWNLVDSGPLLSIFIIIVNDIHNIQHVWRLPVLWLNQELWSRYSSSQEKPKEKTFLDKMSLITISSLNYSVGLGFKTLNWTHVIPQVVVYTSVIKHQIANFYIVKTVLKIPLFPSHCYSSLSKSVTYACIHQAIYIISYPLTSVQELLFWNNAILILVH